MVTTEIAVRLAERTDRSGGPDACWPWRGRPSTSGYGRIRYAGRDDYAHRVAFILTGQTIEDDQVVDHICHDPATCVAPCPHRVCVNPDHLVATSHDENVGRGRSKAAAPRATCRRGHPMTPENVLPHPSGTGRLCKTCKYAGNARSTAKRRDRGTGRIPRTPTATTGGAPW